MLMRRHQRMRADVSPATPAVVAYEDHAAELAAKEARIADLEAKLSEQAAPAAATEQAADHEDDKGGKPGKKASK